MLCLNRTNAESLAEAFGEEMDNWIGKRIGIFATTTLFRGNRVPCLRCRPAPGPAPAGTPQPAQPAPAPAPQPAQPVDGEPRRTLGQEGPVEGGQDYIPF